MSLNRCGSKTGCFCIMILGLFAWTSVADASVPAGQHGVGEFQTAACPFDIPQGVTEGKQLLCGYVTVPARHANPSGPTIRVAVVIFPNTGNQSAADPLVLIAGGPGESAIQAYVPGLAGEAGKHFRSQRDVVVIEVRGARYSEPNLVCHEMFDVQRATLDKRLSPEEMAALQLHAVRACRDRLTRNGVDLAAFNNVESAADIPMILTALGYETFHLYGNSAGTLLAQHVLRDFPTRLRSLIMGSVLPVAIPNWSSIPEIATETFDQILARCAADSACHAAFPRLAADFAQTLATLNRRPVTVPIQYPFNGQTITLLLTGDRLAEWVFWVMYETEAASQLPLALHLISQGDYRPIQGMANVFLPEPTYSLGVRYSVICAEDAAAGVSPLYAPDAVFPRSASSALGIDILTHACQLWNVPPLDDAMNKPVRSDVPTLLLSGEFDHVTPPRFAEMVAQHLHRAYPYTIPGAAHSPIDAGECPLRIALDFLEQPTVAPDSACLQKIRFNFLTTPPPPALQVTAAASFTPTTTLKDSSAGVASRQVKVTLTTPVFEAAYTLTSFAWDKVESLPFGNGRDAPWEQLHRIDGQAAYGGNFSRKWSYRLLGRGSAAFEKNISDAFLTGALIGGVVYTPGPRWNLLLGGGGVYNDFATTLLPAGGFQWKPGHGVSFSLIFPVEAKITYTSPNAKFSAAVDAFEPSVKLTYTLLPSVKIDLGYTSSIFSATDMRHRLADATYLETHFQAGTVGVSYAPFDQLRCYLGGSYYFDREMSILDDTEDVLTEIDLANAFGGTVSLAYDF